MPKSQQTNEGLLDSWGRRNRKIEDKSCIHCGKVFRPARASAKYCSRFCATRYNGGKNKKSECWWVNAKGYIEGKVWLPDGSMIRTKKHRYIMQNHLGRQLLESEDVHHINGDKQDNRIENLEVVTHADHTVIHNEKRQYKRGYKMNITDEERKRRSDRAKACGLGKMGNEAKAKAAK